MKKHRTLSFLIFFTTCHLFAQNLQVETIVNLDASGGVTFGPDGNVYVSDFGPALGTASVNTKVYKLTYGTWEVNEFAAGFSGASGATFDSQGNFYQSNPSGARISKVSTNGVLNLNWVTSGINGGPIGITSDNNDNLYVCLHGTNTIQKITPSGASSVFATSNLFNCPNGITIDPDGNLYACNFNDGRVLKITPDGSVSLFANLPRLNGGVGNGHLTYSNGFIFVATIGGGEIYKLTMDGQQEKIAGVFAAFSNNDGPALQATFSKPNGIAASTTGDTLFINCTVPGWNVSNTALHPGLVRMVTGVCSLSDVDCPLLTDTREPSLTQNDYAQLLPNSPNPFLDQTQIRYQLNQAQKVKVQVLDVNGKVIANLEDAWKQEGEHNFHVSTAEWSAGIYFLQLKGEGFTLSRKMIKR